MSEQACGSATARLRRIHALERAADEQREQLRLQALGLAADVRHCELAQKISDGLKQGRTLAQGLSNGQSLWRGFLGLRAKNGERPERFPWDSALNTAGGLLKIASWWKHRRQ